MVNPARTVQSAFTLIELLIVIAIIGILAAASIPAFSSFTTSQRLSQAAKQVKNDLRSAQNRAINNVGGKAWGVRFNLTGHTYTAFSCDTLTLSSCTCASETIVATKSLADNFTFTGSNDRFIFEQITGAVCDSGASNSVTLELDGSPRTITVTAGGKIEEN